MFGNVDTPNTWRHINPQWTPHTLPAAVLSVPTPSFLLCLYYATKATDAPQKRPQHGMKTAPMEVDPVIPALDPKSKASHAPRGKWVHELNDDEVENEPVAPKKWKATAAPKPSQELDTPKAVEAPPAKKKRRTQQEVAATKEEAERAKEEAERDKAQLSELSQEADKWLVQMDVDNENMKVEQAERAIWWFSNLENEDSGSGGEEFIGYDAVSLSSDEESGSGKGLEGSLEKVCPMLYFWYSSWAKNPHSSQKTYKELHNEIAVLKQKLLEGKRKNGGGKK